jgi:hypothetical protein
MKANATANQISATKNEAAMLLLSFPSIAERITLSGGGQVESLGPRHGGVPPTVPPASQPLRGSIFANNLRGGAMAARVAHNHEDAGSSPAPATSSFSGWNRGSQPYLSPVSALYPAETRGFFKNPITGAIYV